MFILNFSRLKYETVLAYCHNELIFAQKSYEKGEGVKCIEEDEQVRSVLEDIVKKIETLKCTKEDIRKKAQTVNILKKYFENINNTHNKYIKKGDGYIPAFLVLELLSIYTQKGFKEFEKIDFIKYQGYYESYKEKVKGLIPKHFLTAAEIVKNLDNLTLSNRSKNNKKKIVA